MVHDNAFTIFFEKHPALFYALAIFLGTYAGFNFNLILSIPFFCLIIPILFAQQYAKTLLALALAITSTIWIQNTYTMPSLPKEGIFGVAHFEPHTLSIKPKRFGKKWIYHGLVTSFKSDDNSTFIIKNIPCSISIPYDENISRPNGDKIYQVFGCLKQMDKFHYVLQVHKETPWYPVQNSWSLVEMRHQAKQAIQKVIKGDLENPRAATFLAGLVTGEFEDRQMLVEFGRFGLQHLMAISGFHFSIIVAIFGFLLRLIFNRSTATLLVLISFYFMLLGPSASILRAWLMALIPLLGMIFKRSSTAINALGIGLICLIFVNPILITTIGFQFSFGITATILLFYAYFDQLCEFLFAKRTLSEMIEMNLLNQHAYCVVTWIRQGTALMLSVNVLAIPMTLFYFQKIPILSLLYNLFFPFLVSLSMLFLIVAYLLQFLFTPAGNMMHALNNIYTQFTLNFAYNMPNSMDVVWRVNAFSSELLICYMCALFMLGIFIQCLNKSEL